MWRPPLIYLVAATKIKTILGVCAYSEGRTFPVWSLKDALKAVHQTNQWISNKNHQISLAFIIYIKDLLVFVGKISNCFLMMLTSVRRTASFHIPYFIPWFSHQAHAQTWGRLILSGCRNVMKWRTPDNEAHGDRSMKMFLIPVTKWLP